MDRLQEAYQQRKHEEWEKVAWLAHWILSGLVKHPPKPTDLVHKPSTSPTLTWEEKAALEPLMLEKIARVQAQMREAPCSTPAQLGSSSPAT